VIAARTPEDARPGEGLPNDSAISVEVLAARREAWCRLWDALLTPRSIDRYETPRKAAADAA
jgi:hypothetical protein